VSYTTIIAALNTQLAAVSGIKSALTYEPKAVSDPPLVYSLLDSVRREQAGQLTVMRYRVLSRLCIRWQDNERAEQEIFPFVNSLPAAIDADPKLGGVIPSGMAYVTDIQAGFIPINGVQYRILDMYTEVVEKAPVRSGI
jgi:hypothetical protein